MHRLITHLFESQVVVLPLLPDPPLRLGFDSASTPHTPLQLSRLEYIYQHIHQHSHTYTMTSIKPRIHKTYAIESTKIRL